MSQQVRDRAPRALWCKALISAVLCALLASCGGGGGAGGGAGTPLTMTLSATATSNGAVHLSWSADPSAGLAGYDLLRDGTAVFGTHLGGTSVDDTGLTANTRYCYTVVAVSFPLGAVGQSNQACVTTPAYAGGWTIETVATGLNGTQSSYSSFALGPALQRWVAWRQSDGLHVAGSTGGAWSASLLDAGAGSTGATTTAVDSTGNPYVGYARTGGGLILAQNSGGVWSTTVLAPGTGAIAALALDAADQVHLLTAEYNAGLATHVLEYRTNASGVWVAHFLGTDARGLQDAAIAFEPGGAVHLAWSVGSSQFCTITHSRIVAGGQVDTQVDSNTLCSFGLALDAGNVPHLGYQKGFEIRHATLTGGSWTSATVETLSWLGPDATRLAIDTSGRILMVYGDRNLDVRFAIRSGGTWAISSIDRMAQTLSLRSGSDGRAWLVYDAGTPVTLRLARSP